MSDSRILVMYFHLLLKTWLIYPAKLVPAALPYEGCSRCGDLKVSGVYKKCKCECVLYSN